MSPIKLIIIGIILSLVAGCMGLFFPTVEHPELKKLLTMPKEQQLIEFHKYSLAEQVEISWAERTQVHHGNTFLHEIVKDEKIVLFLIEKIKVEKQELLLPQTSYIKRVDILDREDYFLFDIINDAIGTHGCDTKISREQLAFIIDEYISLVNQRDKNRYFVPPFAINNLLNCKQFTYKS